MTKEEIVMQAIREICNTTTSERFAEMNKTAYELAMRVVELSQPSLPSDLDDAAEKYTNDSLNNLGAILRVNVSNAFKSGAEWMAWRGYVDTRAVINEYENWGDGFAKLELDIKEDDDFFEDWQDQDEIIVQIRKK